MHTASTGFGPRERPQILGMLRTLGRGTSVIACASAIAVLALVTRYLVFESNHGDQEVVHRLFDSLLP